MTTILEIAEAVRDACAKVGCARCAEGHKPQLDSGVWKHYHTPLMPVVCDADEIHSIDLTAILAQFADCVMVPREDEVLP